MHVCFLGTAPGYPLPDRFGQTVVVTVGGDRTDPGHYLLDVGDGASSLLIRQGFNHKAIRAIVISHMHADHHGGFAQVVKTCMHLGRSEELLVLAPREGIPVLQAYLQASYLVEPMLGYPIRWLPLAEVAGNAVNLPGGITLQAYPNDHLEPARRRLAEAGLNDHGHTFESYSMVLEHEDTRIVYSGNLKGAKGADELVSFLEHCNVLICELAHVDPAELGRMLAGRRVDKVLLAHFHPKWQGTADAEIVRQVEAGASGGGGLGEILLMNDGDRIACGVAVPHNT